MCTFLYGFAAYQFFHGRINYEEERLFEFFGERYSVRQFGDEFFSDDARLLFVPLCTWLLVRSTIRASARASRSWCVCAEFAASCSVWFADP